MSTKKRVIVTIVILLVAPAYSGSVAAGTDTAPTTASIDLNGITLSTTPPGACSAPGVDLQGWTVTDDTNKQYVFGNSTIEAGENITLYTGNGTNNQTELYWDHGSPVWNNGGDTVFLRNGTTIDQESYDSDSENFTNLDSLQNIEITRVNANPTGDDVDNLTDEYIELENKGSDGVNLSDWTVSDDANQRYLFPDSTDSLLSPNETITLHTGSGTTNETDFYWNASTPIWDNDDQGGDTIYLRNGTLVDKETYSDEETTFELGDSKSVVEINSIHADAEGSEYDNLDDEYVTFTYRTDEDVSLGNRTPVSPEAGDNVTVNATVSDAQEVCLSYTVNGGNETSVTMDSLGNDRYQGVIPGQAPEDNVTYHVYAVDSSGRVSVSETRNFSFKPLDLDIMSGDPVRESGTTTNYSVFGEIVSYRPTVNNFVLSVDGTDRNVDFNVTDLEETAAVSNMTVFASGVVSLSDGKKRVEVRVTNSSGQTVENDTIRLDGDGLKPSVEENVTQTDPFDPDSDSAVTSTDESGDGTVDGREDFDDDGLVTKNEIRFDTDPFDEDSDSDQLQDGFEVSNGFDPLSNDTNNDSTLDPDWDPDSDSLDNLQEQNLGTNPRLPDTDADNLNDSVEVNVHGTDPVDEDTDNDTILDGNEIRLGTDPLSEDSDGDGTPDGSETYTSTKENEQLGVGVDITGEGYVAKNVSIGSTGSVNFPSGKTTDSYISQVVEIESRDEFDSANITFSYNESNFENESNITIVRYNETTGKYDAVETEIDEQANTAKANVSHFSVYGIMDLDPIADLIRDLGGGSSTGSIDLTGWKLKDKCCHNETDPFEINLSDYGSVAPGEVVRIETTEEFDSAIWNNDKGDTIRLIDDSGNMVDSESYNGSEATEGTVLDDFSTTKGEMSISSARPNANGDDNLNPSREYVEITYTANSTTCGFSESVRDLDRLLVAPTYEFLGEKGSDALDSSEPGCDTDGDDIEDKNELGERVTLSDTLAGRIATNYLDISEMEARNTEIAFRWTSDPTKADTDDDGANDRKERTDVGVDSNDLPSNVKVPDVIHVFPATDEEFRDQHENFNMTENGKTYTDYKGYVKRIIDNTNDALEDEFAFERPTPHLVITKNDQGDWGEWDNPDPGSTDQDALVRGRPEIRPIRGIQTTFIADSTIAERRQMRNQLGWHTDQRGADVLSGFSGQPMGDPEPAGTRSLRAAVAGQFIDAAAGTTEGEFINVTGDDADDFGAKQGVFDKDYELTGGLTLIGTDDPKLVTNPETVDNYYMHELGHVLGAIHPDDPDGDGTRFEVPSGTPGVMCKDSCAGFFVLEQYIEGEILVPGGGPIQVELPGTSIANSMNFVDENEFRILNLDYDYRDRGAEQPDGENPARNITSVATAATDETG